MWTLSLPGIYNNTSLCIKCDIDLISSKVRYYITAHISWVLEGKRKHPEQNWVNILISTGLSYQHCETFSNSISVACHKVTDIEHSQDMLTGVEIIAFPLFFFYSDIMLLSYLTGEYSRQYHCICLIVCLC